METIAREDQRYDDVTVLYLQTASEILSLPCHLVEPFIPSQDLINSLSKVEEMLETDTEKITEEQWMDVVEEVRTLIIRHWGNILRQLVALVETGKPTPTVVPENAVDEHEIETNAGDIDAMVEKLALVSASFVCKSDYCEPLDDERKQLVRRMLDDLGLDLVNATEAEVHHYIRAQTWFSAVQRAKQNGSHPQEVINDHDWLLDDATLVRQDSDKEKASLEVLQAEFRLQAATDPTCDIEGVGGEELRQNLVSREIKRSCNLCPNSFGPRKQYPTPDTAKNQT
ncbi:hypothetical protein FRC00_004019 [Tulasnella sp. 408]|nr:hypothetical protein FRC00_004019 [Tulasnella sp. 408]